MYKRQTLDSTSEGIKVSPNTEESMKEIEITEYQGVMPSENKNSHNKKDIQTVKEKTKKIRKICRKKILNIKEVLEMRKGGLINVFNLPINEQREIIKFTSQLNGSTIEVHQKILVKSSRRNISLNIFVNHPEENGNGMLLKMSEYVMSEEVQYLLVKKEQTITEDRYLSESFIAAKWESRMVRRLSRRKLIPNTPVIRVKGCLLYTSTGT